MVEGAEQIFARVEIDAGFAANRRVDLGEECGRDLHVLYAAHIDGCQHAGNVSYDATTKGQQHGGTICPGLAEFGGKALDRGKTFKALAGWKEEDCRPGLAEGVQKTFGPQCPDLWGGHDKVGPASLAEGSVKPRFKL